MGFAIDNLARLFIGLQGESNARMIDIDMSEWMRDWPDAKVDVLVQRPGEDNTYPVETKLRGGHLLWTPKREDVLIAGMGKAQIILTDKNDVELRSRVVQTIIGESIAGTEGEAQDPEQGWVHQVLQAANEVKAQVDVGTGNGLYIVNQRKDDQSKADRTAEEIKAAVSAGKTVLLRTVDGAVYSLCVNLGPNLYFTNVRPGLPGNLNGYGLTVKTAIMTEGDGIQLRSPTNGTLSPNPYKLRLTGAVEAEYDGSKDIVVDIPAGSATPSETVILPETALEGSSPTWAVTTPWEQPFVTGQVYTVKYNGVAYECEAYEVEQGGIMLYLLGNLVAMGLGGNPDAPFMLAAVDNAIGAEMGSYGELEVTDFPASVTMGITASNAPAKAKQYTVIIDSDRSINSSVSFDTLAKMTDAEIQASVSVARLQDGDTYTSSVKQVTRYVQDGAVAIVQLQIGELVDFSGAAYTSDLTGYITFAQGFQPMMSTGYTQTLPYMTHWDRGTAYMRYNGERWEPVGIDQLKEDLGLT